MWLISVWTIYLLLLLLLLLLFCGWYPCVLSISNTALFTCITTTLAPSLVTCDVGPPSFRSPTQRSPASYNSFRALSQANSCTRVSMTYLCPSAVPGCRRRQMSRMTRVQRHSSPVVGRHWSILRDIHTHTHTLAYYRNVFCRNACLGLLYNERLVSLQGASLNNLVNSRCLALFKRFCHNYLSHSVVAACCACSLRVLIYAAYMFSLYLCFGNTASFAYNASFIFIFI